MSALTPIIRDFQEFSLDLHALVYGTLAQVKLVTRSSISSWRSTIKEVISNYDTEHNNKYGDAIIAWLGACTNKDFSNFLPTELLDAFIELQLYIKAGEDSAAKRMLANLQKECEIREFPDYGHQSHQHNLLQELTSSTEDMSLADLGFDQYSVEDDESEDDGGKDASFSESDESNDSQLNSPLGKGSGLILQFNPTQSMML
ncbi:hypothetical protein CVT26_015134 [Gymnopilus dilepis]|uniref:Uncharacterized protein n=1 Tax=Gymnopilus dilepis TaxID=231916 RepID=A0A409WQW0_9AGAR|nr:hypothetical protein CVT26_015134 [Gymnopilus dilepis]